MIFLIFVLLLQEKNLDVDRVWKQTFRLDNSQMVELKYLYFDMELAHFFAFQNGPKFSHSKCYLKEHNHVFARAQEFDFWTGGHEEMRKFI